MQKEHQSTSEGCSTLIEALAQREQGLTDWLAQNAPTVTSKQLHLDENSSERAYWHFGYLMALRDVLAQLYHTSTPKH